MNKFQDREKDYEILYPEESDDYLVRKEQEDFALKSRNQPLGATIAAPHKVRGAFKRTIPKVSRIHVTKIDVNSKPWKDYQAKKINFSEMKKLLGLE